MIMQESSCVILILRIFRFIKLRILVLRCPGNTIFGVLEALKFKIFRSSAPAPLGGGRTAPPPGVNSLASLGRKDTSLRSDPPPPQLNNAGFVGLVQLFKFESGKLTRVLRSHTHFNTVT